MTDTLMTVGEAADYLRLTKATIYKLVSRQQIPHLRPAGAIRFRREEIDTWMRERAEPAENNTPTGYAPGDPGYREEFDGTPQTE